jgi:hypothetical protein
VITYLNWKSRFHSLPCKSDSSASKRNLVLTTELLPSSCPLLKQKRNRTPVTEDLNQSPTKAHLFLKTW